MGETVTTYGANLKRLRKVKRITLEALRDRLKLKRAGQLSTLENSTRVPKADTIMKHAAALECAPVDLLAGVITEYDALRGQSAPLAPAAKAPPELPDHIKAVAEALRALPLSQQRAAAGAALGAIHGYIAALGGAHTSGPDRGARTKRELKRHR